MSPKTKASKAPFPQLLPFTLYSESSINKVLWGPGTGNLWREGRKGWGGGKGKLPL